MKIIGAVSPAAWRAFSRTVVVLGLSLLLGVAVGRVALVLAIVLAVYVALQGWRLLRLEHWLRRRSVEEPPDMSGAWGEVIAIISRIYRRKQHHKAQVTGLLREFRRLTTAMPEGAILLGPEHEILWFNPRVASWLGLKRKRDIGIRIENLVRHPAFIEYLHGGELADGVVIQDPTHANRWYSFHVVRTGGEDRQLLIVRDVSREQHLQSMRKDFVANASHELRSPLTVISGYLDALADDQKLDPTWNSPVQEMRRQAERMNSIIDSLLSLSRLESEEASAHDQLVDIGGMLALLRKDVLARDERPQKITLRLDSDALLRGNESELHSIASNLVSNAVKYTPKDGEVEMRWWTDESGGHLSVRDTGVGIASEHIPRLTERFYRVDAGRARSLGGSGLGLAIVKHALQRHGATLQIQSQEGTGSTFTCHFPADRVVARDRHPLAAIQPS